MSDPLWSLLIGALLIAMVLTGAALARILLTSAMVYLCIGYALGPASLGLIELDPSHHVSLLGRIAEVALLISLFTVGLRMGVPILDRRWILSLRLAFISMTITVGLIAAVGVSGLGLSWGAAVLLGGILAPTDPVLASGFKTERGTDPDSLRFSLAGEGALNDGTAFPFVLLGLGLLDKHGHDLRILHWWSVDLMWSTGGGLAIGAALSGVIGKLIVHLRTRHQQAIGLDEFVSLGIVAVTYGVAQLCHTSGFLAVFAAGLALQRVKEQPREGTTSLGVAPNFRRHAYGALATHSHHASAAMTDAVHGFNGQLEKLAELTMVLLVGAMLPYTTPWSALWWFIPLLFLVIRPVAVLAGTLGEPMDISQRAMIGWFGIRGIGSVFYLLFAIRYGVSGVLAQELITLTLASVAISILVHGVSIRPLLRWYIQRIASPRQPD
ncbi:MULTISPECIES: cation:proton antiporter [Dyella]|uniref:cation:proton antiporter n=1 Tax=Dyella TaxID=231454 RepID=UPI000C85F2D4|nr:MULTISPECIES: sodium:proton antiporter [Dyella]MDR3446698.1 sodium:proton antiporter [Dyella sp.]PMQ03540.1 K(+)/H(+) antiporter NhaP [Dyella sp. AD56]ULU23397.1 sodium:proton antiporter [Dyella terrae]